MASLRRQSGAVASFLSRATKHTVIGERTAARALPSTRHYRTACLTRQTTTQLKSQQHPQSISAQRIPSITAQRVRWNSNATSPPTFKDWGFEDINARLPSTTTTSPPSTPQKPLILIDVREPAELNSTGVIPGAVAIPISSQSDALFLTPDEFETRFGYPKPGVDPEGGDIVFYCKAGVRARAAAQMAYMAGYEEGRIGVYHGSWIDWIGKGGRVERWEGDEF
ncbi:Rhodanese-like domain-containing protein [Aspergillus karnatakaensis]|uniref:Rhodanese-like domain-containing protein n=1 Tax=Aspergillus karnatakaensis TaxID=1810916 RepID=UPI003CCD97CA